MQNGFGLTKALARRFAAFAKDRGGQVAISLTLAATPLIGAVGMGLDYARKIEAQTITQSALDGAALAATSALNAGANKAAYEKAAQDFFDHNKSKDLIGNPQVKVKVDYATGTMSVSINAEVRTTIMKVVGFDSMKLTNSFEGESNGSNGEEATGSFGTSVALPAFTREHKGEIVMVMDYSGSMNWWLGGERKYITMRDQAAKLVSALSQEKTNDYVKFGVVPFSSEVFATMPKKYWYGFKGNGNRASCTRDRKYPYNLSDSTPTNLNNKRHKSKFGQVYQQYSNNPNRWGFYQGWENYRYNCGSYSGWRNLEVQDLTDQHTDTYNKILSMSPYGGTHIAVGMEMGFHLLSPQAPFTNGVAYNTEDTEKAIILLTDGQQTTKAFGPGGAYSSYQGEDNLETLCTNIKAKGIRILTISYDLYDTDTETRLENCATSSDDFYDANTKNELISSFQGITAKLARDMFLAK